VRLSDPVHPLPDLAHQFGHPAEPGPAGPGLHLLCAGVELSGRRLCLAQTLGGLL